MSIHPSILEYNTNGLEQKLQFLKINKKSLKLLLNLDSTTLNLHLDFIGKDFAQTRKVMRSLDMKTVFVELQKVFSKTKLNLTIHLMNELEDYKFDFVFLKNYKPNKNWNYTFYTNKSYTKIYKKLAEYAKIGIWLDFDEWEKFDIKKDQGSEYLIMTVKAGLSGQSKIKSWNEKVIQLAKTNQTKNFLIDGGWQMDEIKTLIQEHKPINLNFVSYSSFWKTLGVNL